VEGEEGEPFSEFSVRGVEGDVSTTDKSFNVSVINDAMFAIERPALRVRASVVCAMRGWVDCAKDTIDSDVLHVCDRCSVLKLKQNANDPLTDTST
jgi:hypothetical protein